jgi:hypothetical protein
MINVLRECKNRNTRKNKTYFVNLVLKYEPNQKISLIYNKDKWSIQKIAYNIISKKEGKNICIS